MFFPKSSRHFNRLETILSNARSELVLCGVKELPKIKEGLSAAVGRGLTIRPTSYKQELGMGQGEFSCRQSRRNAISFLQYTSGSTGAPKGVIVSHDNLISNQKQIQSAFGCNSDSLILSWLPFYHDMGLIGSILHTLYVGCTCALMPPLAVVQHPLQWLQAISDLRATHSGGPNFIYDLCVQSVRREESGRLDLSSWQVAYNGSEPIRRSTIEHFRNAFAPAGFNPGAFFPCYGLAEATLLVSGGQYQPGQAEAVASGRVAEGTDLLIIDPATRQQAAQGEICVAGRSISEGYWNQDNKALFYLRDGKSYLRTGDIGTVHQEQLYVTGRLKEIIFINGKNYFPYDLENEVARTVAEVEENGVVVSYVPETVERPLVLAELKRAFLHTDKQAILQAIDRVVIALTGVEAYDILLMGPRQIPRTSSGKLQRVQCREAYLKNEFSAIANKRNAPAEAETGIMALAEAIVAGGQHHLLTDYLILVLNGKLKTGLTRATFPQNLMELGIDSLKGVEVANQIHRHLKLNLEVTQLMNLKTTEELERFIANLLWLKNLQPNGEEITI